MARLSSQNLFVKYFMKHYIFIFIVCFMPAFYMLHIGINGGSKMFYFGAGVNLLVGFVWVVLHKIKGKDYIVEKLIPFLKPL